MMKATTLVFNRAQSTLLFAPITRSFCSCSTRQAPKALKVNNVSGSTGHKLDNNTDGPRTKRFKKVIKNTGKGLAHDMAELPAVSRRVTLTDPDAARDLVREWGIDKMHDAIVVEPYAGPGGLTRALLELKNVKRVIAIEEAYRYRTYLEAALPPGDDPSRLAVITSDPFQWETYTEIEERGLLKDVEKVSWDQVHPNLFLACQLPHTRHGEQLFVQFLLTSAGKMWYYQYGRFQMGYLGPDEYWSKLTAPPGSTKHAKLAVFLPMLMQAERYDGYHDFEPLDEYFHRPKGKSVKLSAIKLTPNVRVPVKNFESLEYCTRNMFISKAQPWRKAVAALSPGAENLIPAMEKAGITKGDVKVRDLTLEDWTIIANIFDDWPFRPATLFDEGLFSSWDP
ncbi:S-adenosyl-L-methionine-dependent methyltransferase [Meredithblackwellia eburnea MCA 4105]